MPLVITNTPFMGRLRSVLGYTVALAFGITLLCTIIDAQMGPPPLAAGQMLSPVVLDRQGRLLRSFTTAEGRWRLPVTTGDVDPRYLAMLQAFEDRRYASHPGFDLLAFARSGIEFLRVGRLQSGGSTLTMQTARLLMGRHEKTFLGKLEQIVRAVQIERRLSKTEIMDLYLRLAPFGGNLEGVRAASLAYLGKEPLRLSLGEAALLVALPQSPELRRPDLYPARARKARDRVLAVALGAGVIDAVEAQAAQAEPVPTARKAFPQWAPHVAETELARDPGATEIRTTLDRDLQISLEALAADAAIATGKRLSVALIAVDHASGEIRAQVGSAGYLDRERLGAIDMTAAIRSPGSALKPFIYGLSFEQGIAAPETLIEDTPTRFGSYAPKNFDDSFHGTVSVASALQQSLNIPAVKLLAAVGPARFLGRLRETGTTLDMPDTSIPSLAVALGGLGLTLRDLTQLYAGLARGGEAVPLTVRPRVVAAQPIRLLDPSAAWVLGQILKGTPPPRNAKGGGIAYKTGTSYGYRDAWAAGFDGQTTIAVWIGRPDGTATPGLTGVSAAAPILFDAFARVALKRTPLARPPHGAVIVSNATLPPPLRVFLADKPVQLARGPYADPPVAIAFPPDRAELELMTDGTASPTMHGPVLQLKAEGGVLPLTWLVDDVPLASDAFRREVNFTPTGPGYVRLSVIDANGQADRVTVLLR
jgi:penicillin-binding protein 1C